MTDRNRESVPDNWSLVKESADHRTYLVQKVDTLNIRVSAEEQTTWKECKGEEGLKDRCKPVWPSGKALGWYEEGPRFELASALLSLQKLWAVKSTADNSVTLSLTN